MSNLGKKSMWTAAFIVGAASVLILLLVHGASHLPTGWQGVAELLRSLAWVIVLGNAGFVFWTIHRMTVPVRNLLDQARARGLTPDTADEPAVARRRPHEDELETMADVCNRLTQVLPAVQARQLFPEIVCSSQAMLQVLTVLERAARATATVLIQGESGTGKELVARNIHRHSDRREHPFVPINCAAIPATLLESELFGHEKGAFTGASQARIGRIEAAEGGTLFLDEIGEMPMDMQAKLLRVLQERVVTPVGGNRSVPVDVRVISATNRNLQTMVKEGTFRQDLYYRLNVLPIRLPPLRERPEEIPVLVRAFLRRFADQPAKITPEAMRFLYAYQWPGNVRELENAIEAALVLAEDTIRPEHLPPHVAPDPQTPPVLDTEAEHPRPQTVSSGPLPADAEPIVDDGEQPQDEQSEASLDDALTAFERHRIVDALTRADGVQVEAARLLGIKERSLWHRIKKYNIDVSLFRGETGDDEPA
jgi:transcriptional regulator with GAF, ATPase, and Fis domain